MSEARMRHTASRQKVRPVPCRIQVRNVVYQQGDTADEALKELLLEDGGYDYVIGTDEAGKGEWYGPLVVACIALKQKDIPAMRKKGVRDSKKLCRKTLLRIGRDLAEDVK